MFSLRNVLLKLGLLWVTTGCSANQVVLGEIEGVARVSLLNAPATLQFDQACVLAQTQQVLGALTQQQVVQYKTRLFAEHTLVKNTLATESIQIDWLAQQQQLWFDLQDTAKFIVYDQVKQRYQLLGLTAGTVDFKRCIQPL